MYWPVPCQILKANLLDRQEKCTAYINPDDQRMNEVRSL